MRDFRAELAHEACWSPQTQRLFEVHGEPLEDCILQNREELIGLCEFIETHGIRSWLEIGTWTGRLTSALQRLFHFERVAVCDHGWARRKGFDIHLPPECDFYQGDSRSAFYGSWRHALGPVDLVFIDADHSYQGVKRDFETNRGFPQRFLALHDITGYHRATEGVGRFWSELNQGQKHEIIRPHLELGLDCSTMGIGIWSEVP